MVDSFIKNYKIIEEDYRVDDLLDFSSQIHDFKKTIDGIKDNAVIGLIGKFGSGKSTMLYQLYKEQEQDADEKWIIFDAWKYPERKELWEGFILDAASQLDKKLFEQAREKIDGTKNSGVKGLINVLFEGANFFIPGASIGKNFTSLLRSSPIRRVFEFQEILKEIIKKENKNLFIVVEDIDRSGDRGIFFLETLRSFIKENKLGKKIIVIAPIGDDFFKANEVSYLKTVDYRIDFKISKINFETFVEKVFTEDIASQNFFKNNMNYLFNLLIKQKGITLREIKHVLRLADLRFKKLENSDRDKIDVSIFILFEAINYFGEKFLNLINDKKLLRDDFWGKKFLLMAGNDLNEENFNHAGLKINLPLIFSGNNYRPIYHQDIFEDNTGYYMTDFYLKLIE